MLPGASPVQRTIPGYGFTLTLRDPALLYQPAHSRVVEVKSAAEFAAGSDIDILAQPAIGRRMTLKLRGKKSIITGVSWAPRLNYYDWTHISRD